MIAHELMMDEFGRIFIIYGYMLPTLVMLVWMMWRVYSEFKAGKRYASSFIRDCLSLFIPGASLFAVCMLLVLAIEEGALWLERHWEPWRMAGTRARSIMRMLLHMRDTD